MIEYETFAEYNEYNHLSAWAEERHRLNLTIYDCRNCNKPIRLNQSYHLDAFGIEHLLCPSDARPPVRIVPKISPVTGRAIRKRGMT